MNRRAKLLPFIRPEQTRQIVTQHHACNTRVFSLVLQAKIQRIVTLSLLVDPTPDTMLMEVTRIQARLDKLFGVPVDVLRPKALPEGIRDRMIYEVTPV